MYSQKQMVSLTLKTIAIITEKRLVFVNESQPTFS